MAATTDDCMWSTVSCLTYLVAANLVWRMACGINLIHSIKGAVLERHVHEVCFDIIAAVRHTMACLLVVMQAPADLVGVVVQT